jgi:hypothetical protein
MDGKELTALFTCCGYQVRIVGNDLANIVQDMADSLQWVVAGQSKSQFARASRSPTSLACHGTGAPAKYTGRGFLDAKADNEALEVPPAVLSSYKSAELLPKGEGLSTRLSLSSLGTKRSASIRLKRVTPDVSLSPLLIGKNWQLPKVARSRACAWLATIWTSRKPDEYQGFGGLESNKLTSRSNR